MLTIYDTILVNFAKILKFMKREFDTMELRSFWRQSLTEKSLGLVIIITE